MREFTVMFHSVTQIAEFVNMVNRYPFHAWLFQGTAKLDAKSLLSLCCLSLNTPLTLCVPEQSSELGTFAADLTPFLA